MLVMVLPYHASCGAMLLLSAAGDGAIKTTWLSRCRIDVGHGVMSLLSRCDNDTVKASLTMALPSRCLQ
jgi:hypothetical protein